MRRLNEQKRIHNLTLEKPVRSACGFCSPFDSEKYTVTRCEMGDAGKFGDAADFLASLLSIQYELRDR